MGLFTATISAVRKGLARTREALLGGLRTIVAGKPLSDDLIDQIEDYLIKADVGVKATVAIIEELREAHAAGDLERGEDAIDFLKDRLKSRFSTMNRAVATAAVQPTVILVAGINGAGKTTSVAKIAKSLRDEGRSVLLAAADTFRAGAVAQLEIWSQRLGVDIVKGASGADPAAVAYDAAEAALARGTDVLLIDTAGRLHTQKNLMEQLTKIRRVVTNLQLTKIRRVVTKKIPDAPHEVLLVLDATSGQTAIAQAQEFKDSIDVTGIFLAKLDGTAKGGIVIAIQDALDIPVKLVGVGETPEDVEPFDPESFIDAMFEG